MAPLLIMVGRLDHYVTRIVLGSYLAGLLFMASLFTLVDMLLGLSGYIETAEAHGIGFFGLVLNLLLYYLVFQPIVFVTIAPFVTVIAGMFAVARLMSSNEFVPMLFTGRSATRVLAPLFVTGLVSMSAMLICWEWVVPFVAEPLQSARATLVGGADEYSIPDVVVELSEGSVDRTLFVGQYRHDEQRMIAPVLVERGSSRDDVLLVQATSAEWDPQAGDWQLLDGRRLTESASRNQAKLGVAGVTPDLLWRVGKEGRDTVVLSYSDLLDLQEIRPQRRDFRLAFHSHLTFPLANLVLLLLVLPLAMHYERGGQVERVVLAIVLCAAYFFTDLTCQSLGMSMLHPVLAAWLPTILFGSFGIAFFSGVRT